MRDLGVHLRSARPVAAGRRSAAVTALINLGAARPDRRAVLQLLCVKLDVKRSRQDTQRYDPTYGPAWVNSPRAKKEEKIRRSNPHIKKKKKLFIFDSKFRNNQIRPRNKSRLASQLAGLLTDLISRSSRSWQGLMLLQAFLNSIVSVCR